MDQIIHSQHLAYQETFQPPRHTFLLKVDKMLCVAIYNPFHSAGMRLAVVVGACIIIDIEQNVGVVSDQRRVITVITNIVVILSWLVRSVLRPGDNLSHNIRKHYLERRKDAETL